MNLTEILSTVGVAVGAFGGFEFIKYLLNRRTNGRVAEAEADDAELGVFIRRVEALDKQLEVKDNQINLKDEQIKAADSRYSEQLKRYDEQTERLRAIQDECSQLQNKISQLELKCAHAQLWECQRASCKQRKPSNPLLYGMEYTPFEPKQND
jgi:hypothetical protein